MPLLALLTVTAGFQVIWKTDGLLFAWDLLQYFLLSALACFCLSQKRLKSIVSALSSSQESFDMRQGNLFLNFLVLSLHV